MAQRVTQDDIIKMNNLYLQLHTYAAVAREVGFSASTVKKYIIKNYAPPAKLVKQEFHLSDLPKSNYTAFNMVKNWGDMCVLSDKEKEEIKELWKELAI